MRKKNSPCIVTVCFTLDHELVFYCSTINYHKFIILKWHKFIMSQNWERGFEYRLARYHKAESKAVISSEVQGLPPSS